MSWLLDQVVADGRVPLGPVLAAGQELGLDGVVVAVEVVALGAGGAVAVVGVELLEVLQAALEVVAFEDAGVVEGGDAGGGAGEAAAAALAGHVAEAAVGVLAAASRTGWTCR